MPQNIQNEGPLRKNLSSEPAPEPAPTAKPDYLKYLEIIGKILTLSATLGLIIGCGMAFVYLTNINFISVFPDVIREPSSLIAVIAVIGLLVLLFGLSFFAPYIFAPYILFLQSNYVNNPPLRELFRTKYKNFPILFWILNLIVILYFTILITAFMEWEWVVPPWILTIIITFSSVIITIMALFQIWKQKQHNETNQENRVNFIEILIESLPFILLIFFIYSTTFSTLWFLLQLLDGIDDIWQYVLLFAYGGFLIANNWIIGNYLCLYPENKNKAIMFFPFALSILLLGGISVKAHNFPSYVFTPIRFTEKSDNSSWYLLHNNFQKNDDTQEVSGIEKADLLRLKEKFQHPSWHTGWQCFNLPYQRNNALYGYMAWNLGNTKVFCPASVSNYKNAECKSTDKDKECTEYEQKRANEKALSQCLVIDGKFLQIMDEQYIGMPKKENNVSGENLQTERTISNLPSDIKIHQ
jgi:hypothetical protein